MKFNHIWLHHLAMDKTITYIETKSEEGAICSFKVSLNPDTLLELCRTPVENPFFEPCHAPGYTITEEYECFDTLEAFYERCHISSAPLLTRKFQKLLPGHILVLEEICVNDCYLFCGLIDGQYEALCVFEPQTKDIKILTDDTKKSEQGSLRNSRQLSVTPSGTAADSGWLLRYPQNYQPESSYPTICLVTESLMEDAFPPLLEAADDFCRKQCFVLQVLIPHDLSGAMDAVSQAISNAHQKEQTMDRNRLALFGQHFGGYVVHMLIASDFPAATAVTFDGIANAVGCGAISYEFRDVPDYKALWDVSPMKYARHFKIPMLLLTNPADQRYGSQEVPTLFQMLLDQNTPARMIQLPSTAQYPNTSDAWHIFYEEITLWIYKYLKEQP